MKRQIKLKTKKPKIHVQEREEIPKPGHLVDVFNAVYQDIFNLYEAF